MLLKKLRPSIWLPSIMVAWGVVMTLMGIVQNYHGLLSARIFLGVAEAGLFPGVCPCGTPSISADIGKVWSTITRCGTADTKSKSARRSSSPQLQ